MKKIFSVLLVALFVLPMSAQVSRVGDKYFADGQMMRSKGFAAYMQQNAEATLARQFKSGKVVADVGWGLFGGGLGLTAIGFITTGAIVDTTAPQGVGQAMGGAMIGGAIGATIVGCGCAITSAGIICLAVGYDRMHRTADVFAVQHNQSKSQAYLSLQTSSNGLGLALNF